MCIFMVRTYTVNPLILVSIKFTTNDILASSVSMNGHVLCNTINFLAHIKICDIYPIANFANIYGTLMLMVLYYGAPHLTCRDKEELE